MKRIIIAGIYRSGTTWQFNAVRVILKQAGQIFNQYNIYHPSLAIVNEGAVWEIYKVHGVTPQPPKGGVKATFIFTSWRKREEILQSFRRCFPHIKVGEEWLLQAESDYKNWKALSNYDMTYTEMLNNKPAVIKKLAAVLGLTINVEQVLAELETLQPPTDIEYDPVTCYFRRHRREM